MVLLNAKEVLKRTIIVKKDAIVTEIITGSGQALVLWLRGIRDQQPLVQFPASKNRIEYIHEP